jgi:hypothetical protein
MKSKTKDDIDHEGLAIHSTTTSNSQIGTIAMSLSLNCLIHGEVQEKMFTLEIEKTKNVSILKDLIKEKKAPHLDHVAASDLQLWKVDLSLDELGEEPVHDNLDNYSSSKLSPPRRKLSFFFNGALDDEHLHIIAEAPGMSQVNAIDPAVPSQTRER